MGQEESTFRAPARLTSLKILVVTDTHLSGYHMNQFALWYSKFKPAYDVILHAGDFANLEQKDHEDVIKELQGEQHSAETLLFFQEHVRAPIAFVPGNHDPKKLFDGVVPPLANVINLHKKAIVLDENLVLLGLGGSGPAKKAEAGSLPETSYSTEEAYSKELTETFAKAYGRFGPAAQFLLLTHAGPADSSTTKVAKVSEGSAGLSALLDAQKDRILCSVHGMTHSAAGLCDGVVNPGGLCTGKFCELNLVKGIDGKWKVGSTKFYDLGD